MSNKTNPRTPGSGYSFVTRSVSSHTQPGAALGAGTPTNHWETFERSTSNTGEHPTDSCRHSNESDNVTQEPRAVAFRGPETMLLNSGFEHADDEALYDGMLVVRFADHIVPG